jgi:hypothetical protein
MRGEEGASLYAARLDPKQEPLKDPLPGLKKQLKSEYDDLPEERIEEVAEHSLAKYATARVQEFVPELAWRDARRHLTERPDGATTVRLSRSGLLAEREPE